ncbi:MAG: hypothetical protein AB1486_32885 [Planctomycetota bacterium]
MMTGHSVAEIIISPEPATRTVYADSSLELPETKARLVRLPFAKTAAAHDRLSVGIVALAAQLRGTGILPCDALASIIGSAQKRQIAKINLKALESGAALLARA